MNFWTIMLIIHAVFSAITLIVVWDFANDTKKIILREMPDYAKYAKFTFAERIRKLFITIILCAMPIINIGIFFLSVCKSEDIQKRTVDKLLAEARFEKYVYEMRFNKDKNSIDWLKEEAVSK